MINDLAFNQDFTCLLVSTTENHHIFNCDPFGEFYLVPKTTPDQQSNGTSLLRMLFSTSLTIIVSEREGEDGRVLKIFNLKQNLKICELTFPLRILQVKLNRKRMVVFLEMGLIYIYDLSSIRLIKVLEVEAYLGHLGDDGLGLPVTADLSADDRSFLVLPLLAVNELTDLLNSELSPLEPSRGLCQDTSHISGKDGVSQTGTSLVSLIELTQKNDPTEFTSKRPFTTLRDIQKDSAGWILVYDTMLLRPRLLYKAHDSAIAKIVISTNSNYIATASSKGTIIRVCHISTETEPSQDEKLHITQVTNLRRGHNPAKINALKFNLDLSLLGCGSESGTVHLFTVNKRDSSLDTSSDVKNDKSSPVYEGDLSDEEPNPKLSSLEDLNENLANLLLLTESEGVAAKTREKEKEKQHGGSYFSALKSSSKFINNQYTKLLIKKLPYKHYLKNLIWEKPRRSFAYVKLPESVTVLSHSKHVEIGFSATGFLMLASYSSGKLHQYQLPRGESEEREQCELVSLNSLV